MPKNILLKYTKTYIDSVTKKIINILKNKHYDFEPEDEYGNERKKNKIFRTKYDLEIDDEVDLIKDNLSSESICEVQKDNSNDKKRKGNLMFIYMLILNLSQDGRIYNPVKVYLKVEMVQITGNKKVVLIISMHEPEYEMEPKYKSLPNKLKGKKYEK